MHLRNLENIEGQREPAKGAKEKDMPGIARFI